MKHKPELAGQPLAPAVLTNVAGSHRAHVTGAMESGDTDKYYAWNMMFEEIGHKWLTWRLWFSLAVELRDAGL